MKCKYCQPNDRGFFDDLGCNILGDDEESVHVSISPFGEIEILLDVEINIQPCDEKIL